MYIHSKFRDYYDCIQKYGGDDSQHWVRKQETTLLQSGEPAVMHIRDAESSVFYLPYGSTMRMAVSDWLWLGVAGKVFPIYAAKNDWADSLSYHYTVDSVGAAMKAISNKAFEDFSKKHKYSKKSYKDLLLLRFSDTRPFEYIFEKYQTAIWLIDKDPNRRVTYRLTSNPTLQDYDFQTVMDPATCYQEITMFLSGVLGCACADTIDIADEHRIAGHGFDKWSFRKLPTKRAK